MTLSSTQRLDAFTDAAFAFAVTLMVVGGGGAAPDYATLLAAVQAAPSFAIGFAIIGLFWFTHVRWRQIRGDGDWRSVLLTLLLVFVVLVYVHPLRAMAASFAAFLGGRASTYGGYLAEMFAMYGTGFTVMSLIVVAMFSDALRQPELDVQTRSEARGQRIIWSILALTGIVSTAMTFTAVAWLAPFAYSTLPITIGIFASRWNWSGARQR